MSTTPSRYFRDCFPGTTTYHLSKAWESLVASTPLEYGAVNFEMIAQSIETFKQRVEERHGSRSLTGVRALLEDLDHPVAKLSAYFANPNDSNLTREDAAVFVTAVEHHLDELKEMARELDEEK